MALRQQLQKPFEGRAILQVVIHMLHHCQRRHAGKGWMSCCPKAEIIADVIVKVEAVGHELPNSCTQRCVVWRIPMEQRIHVYNQRVIGFEPRHLQILLSFQIYCYSCQLTQRST